MMNTFLYILGNIFNDIMEIVRPIIVLAVIIGLIGLVDNLPSVCEFFSTFLAL